VADGVSSFSGKSTEKASLLTMFSFFQKKTGLGSLVSLAFQCWLVTITCCSGIFGKEFSMLNFLLENQNNILQIP
jgi:hypothetical protein